MKKSRSNYRDLRLEGYVRNRNIIGKKQAKNRSFGFYFYASCIALLLIALGCATLYIRSSIGVIDREISAQEEQIEDLSKTKRSLVARMDSIVNSDTVLEDAKFKLGMVYPEEDQLVYIEVNERTEENDVNQNVYLNPVLSVLKFFNWD